MQSVAFLCFHNIVTLVDLVFKFSTGDSLYLIFLLNFDPLETSKLHCNS